MTANQEGDEIASQRKRPSRKLLVALAAIVGLWAIGQILRDDWPLSAFLFYMPSPAIVALAGGYALGCALKRRGRRALGALVLLAAPLVFFLFIENRFFAAPAPAADGKYRLIHWNAQGHLSRPSAGDLLVAQEADLYVLTEISSAASVEEFSRKLGPEYSFDTFGELAVVGRGSLVWGSSVVDLGRFKIWPLVWTHEGERLKILVVDLPSELNVTRDPLLRLVNETIEREKPDLVVGDFNAPRRSHALSELPAGYRHAYDSIGRGWGYTWPVPAPMLALDQCIVSERLIPRRYQLDSTWHSDHRMQILDYDLHESR